MTMQNRYAVKRAAMLEAIRYEHITEDDPKRKEKVQEQWRKAEEDAKSGKVICLTDLLISAGM